MDREILFKVYEDMISFYIISGATIPSRVVDLKKSTVLSDYTQVSLSYRTISSLLSSLFIFCSLT